MPYASVGRTRVYYEGHGSDGPVVLLAHGSGGHHAIWWQQIPHLRERYRVLALDFPGFGRSSFPADAYDTSAYPDCILAVLDHADVEQAVLVGQSLGCAPSLAVAVSHPRRVRGVVLAHGLGGIDDQEIRGLEAADRLEAVKLPVLDRLMTREFQQRRPDLVFLFRQLGGFNAATNDALRIPEVGPTSLSQVRELIATGVPVCYLAGGGDAVISPATYARLRELLPEADYEAVPGAPHSMYWEAPDRFNAVLDRALERLLRRTRTSSRADDRAVR